MDKTLADAWDEGYNEGVDDAEQHRCYDPGQNPYRSTKQPVPPDAEHYSADVEMWMFSPSFGEWFEVRASGPGQLLLYAGSPPEIADPYAPVWLITFIGGEFDGCKKLDNPRIERWEEL